MKKIDALFLLFVTIVFQFHMVYAEQLYLPTESSDENWFEGNSQYTIIGNKDAAYACGIADGEGKVLVAAAYYVTETPLSFLISTPEDKWGFFDKQSGIYHIPQYDEIYDFFCTDPHYPILVGLDGSYHYVDRKTCELAFAVSFSGYCEYSEFYNGYALGVDIKYLEDGGIQKKYTLINTEGDSVIFPEEIMPFGNVQSNGLVRIAALGKDGCSLYGIGDTKGNVILRPEYEWICDYQCGYASVRLGELWGHVNEAGTLVISPRYDLWSEYDAGYYFQPDGTATFRLEDGSTITIDAEGKVIKKQNIR